ncbi:hypothetical protein F5146DRAFT_1057988 [Armillaria mellea]|nr:hypothetical protein F5146DRAFT_1057988 [Armillaria mellea]
MNPHSSDEDDDAPEAVSLSQSKKLIQQQNSSIRQFENAQKEKKRAKNRERDRKLKERAQGRKKGKGDEDEDEDDNDAVARMRRAMKEAGDESDEDMDEMYDEEDEGNEEEENDEEEEEFHGFDAPRKSNHLHDHLFASAAASVPSVEKKTKPKYSKEAKKTGKRKRTTAKDCVLGSRVIRALPDPNKPPSGTPSMVPTAKVRKFLDRSLSLRNTDKRVGSWERRSANIGSMRIDHGPAAHFVRQQS